jgi:hypothetical protein
MYARYAIPAWIALIVSSLLLGCGELDTVFPSGTYQVDALVNKKTALSKSALISKDDQVYPYFANQVGDDPDLTGLIVFLQNPQGQTAGAKIQYVLKAGTVVPKTEVISLSQQNLPAEILVPVGAMDKDLPPFVLPETLSAGPYILVYQVLGEDGVLYRGEKNVFYLGDAAFSLERISTYLPDVSGSSPFPQGLAVMLEAQIVSDERLDPYVIWYNGKKRFSEGYAAKGACLILWNAPEEIGFQTIRAELLPQGPVSNFSGKFTEISLPVSAQANIPGYFSGDVDQIAYLYQLQGGLRDSIAPEAADRALVFRGAKNSPRWMPSGSIYGLGIGTGDVYTLPAFSPVAPEEGAEKPEHAGRFMLRFRPVAAGTIFSVRFDSGSPSEAVFMDLSFSGEDLILQIKTPEKSESVSLGHNPGEAEGFTSLFIDFSAGDRSFEAGLSLENRTEGPARLQKLAFSGPLVPAVTGAGSLQFGASLTQAPQKADDSQAEQIFPVSAIIDEFALAWGNHFPRIEPEEAYAATGEKTPDPASGEAEYTELPPDGEDAPDPQNAS